MQGKGMKLVDIPNAHHRLQKLKPDEELVKHLHQAMYNRPGTVGTLPLVCTCPEYFIVDAASPERKVLS